METEAYPSGSQSEVTTPPNLGRQTRATIHSKWGANMESSIHDIYVVYTESCFSRTAHYVLIMASSDLVTWGTTSNPI